MAKLVPILDCEKFLNMLVTVERIGLPSLNGGMVSEDHHSIELDVIDESQKVRHFVTVPKTQIAAIWAAVDFPTEQQ